jgi:hypothetical protein
MSETAHLGLRPFLRYLQRASVESRFLSVRNDDFFGLTPELDLCGMCRFSKGPFIMMPRCLER